MDDPFNFTEIRVRQPGKILSGRACYEIFGGGKQLVAVATEVEGRSVLDKITKLMPDTRALMVTTAAGEAMFTMVFHAGRFMVELTDPDDNPVGKIRIGGSRRHYTLLDSGNEVVGEVVGDLAVKRFIVTGPGKVPIAEFRKTFAGPVKEAFTSADHYTLKFGAVRVAPVTRILTVFVPVVLDLVKYGPA